MRSLPYAVMALVHLGVLVGFLRLAVRDRAPSTVLACVVSAGLTYDNAMLAAGNLLGDGDVLRLLSLPRFWVHGLITPLLMVVVLSWARDLGVPWARRRAAAVVVGTLTAALVLLGARNEVLHLDVEPTDEHGILRYTYVEPLHSLPGPVITVVVLVVLGAAIGRRTGSWWLLGGASFMFLASGGGAGTPYVANVGETVLAVTLLVTATLAQRARDDRGTLPSTTGQEEGRP